MAIVTPGTERDDNEKSYTISGVRADLPRADIVELTSADNAEDQIIDKIRDQIKKAGGTLREIYIDTHGAPDQLWAGEGINSFIDTPLLLSRIKELQDELGIKIADRIVFTGCNEFADMSPGEIRTISMTAQQLGADIIGNTTISFSDKSGNVAKKVIFTKDGHVNTAPNSRPYEWQTVYNYYASTITSSSDPIFPVIDQREHSSVWLSCYDGDKPINQGAACQAEQAENALRGVERQIPDIEARHAEQNRLPIEHGLYEYKQNPLTGNEKLSSMPIKAWLNVFMKIENQAFNGQKKWDSYFKFLGDSSSILLKMIYGGYVDGDMNAEDLVKLQEQFIRSLTPEEREAFNKIVNEQRHEIATPSSDSNEPKARTDSKPSHRAALTPANENDTTESSPRLASEERHQQKGPAPENRSQALAYMHP